ncbi:LGFP repeat-containing protein [Actinokineospora sp. HUAS TT18]|uniref:LGFP repeat-containing protein n=1 Tax=Actinokineospora sp. HUAS TT18 TaxID=3447451 RepID=UPI003F5247EE
MAALAAGSVVLTALPALAQQAPTTPTTPSTSDSAVTAAPAEQAPAAQQAPAAPAAEPAPAADEPDAGTLAIQQKYATFGESGPLSEITTAADGGKFASFAKWGTTVVITWNSAYGAHWFSGAIAAKWTAAGGADVYGYAVADQGATIGRPGAAAGFDKGFSVYYSDSTGAHTLSGEVRSKYWALGHTAGSFGFPETDNLILPPSENNVAGEFAQFQGQVSIFDPSNGPAVWISGALRQKFWNMGSIAGLGYPVSDQEFYFNRQGYTVELPKGRTIYWTAQTGATLLEDGPVKAKYLALGGIQSNFGFPETDVLDTPGVAGKFAQFQGQVSIFWSEPTGAHWISGALRQRFWNNGSIGRFGLPTSDQLGTGDIWGNSGLYILFGADKAILWNAGVGAFEVSGDFLARLRSDGDVKYYGFPNTERIGLPGRSTFQQFAHASIFETPYGPLTVGWVMREGWWYLGGYTGTLGMPTAMEYYPYDAFVVQQFENGYLYCDFRPANPDDDYCDWEYGTSPYPHTQNSTAAADKKSAVAPVRDGRFVIRATERN